MKAGGHATNHSREMIRLLGEGPMRVDDLLGAVYSMIPPGKALRWMDHKYKRVSPWTGEKIKSRINRTEEEDILFGQVAMARHYLHALRQHGAVEFGEVRGEQWAWLTPLGYLRHFMQRSDDAEDDSGAD